MLENRLIILAASLVLFSCYGTVDRIDGDVGTDTGIDTAADTGTDVTPDTGADTLVDPGVDTHMDTGMDVPIPGCLSGSDCPPDRFCEWSPGTCGPEMPGTCTLFGDGDCPTIYAPECGCDAMTYGNACERRNHGVSMLHTGECGTERVCAPWLDECNDGEICEAPIDSCDIMGVTGVCQAIRDDCGWLWDPVCGCDRLTYANDCERQMAGVWLDHRGECGDRCGEGVGLPPCPDGSFCELPTNSCGEWGEGECMIVPLACPDLWNPVCGCNAVTYANDCDRRSARVQLLHRGPC